MAKLNEQQVVLEEFLREKIREAIVEEMMSLAEWDPHEWDEDPASFGPEHGQSRMDPEEGEMVWSEPHRQWMDRHSWDSTHAHDPSDPELQMDPRDRQGMIDSLLSMEFDENKKIHMEHINRMIKENVKKYMKGKK
jgi:hypothetical protein